ncbi:hypothetical protein [Occallatibacter riparius]|uniref:Uncharacterized protein n=1 Tax=Occallatibacter riparius TaxID=1002689 RepID=A0A9J7BTF7_9BACT|nr:hypothetical protein [Occallatibacter riparius]UWZ84190.1 hypothetical protein MOP44_27040 [Occallatibacter riparius]
MFWCFFPLFAALAVPWPLAVWYLRRLGRWEEADAIEDDADSKGGLNSYVFMKWTSLLLVAPIGFFTLLAIPIHFTITDSEIRVGHFGSLRSETFPMNEARRLTIVDGYRLRDGSFRAERDVIVDFADGRRLRGNQVGDGGSNVPDDVLQMLIAKTGLTPQHTSTIEDVPKQMNP